VEQLKQVLNWQLAQFEGQAALTLCKASKNRRAIDKEKSLGRGIVFL
jgi:hypothetical protein